MSDRERWIVYPLLVLAIGLALQPRITMVDVQFGTVRCEKLVCGDAAVAQSLTSKAITSEELASTQVKSRNVTAESFTGNELTVNRAKATGELDAARTKSAVVSTGMLVATAASIDTSTSKLHSTQHLRVTDALGVRHADLRATPEGGQLDVVRYGRGSKGPFESRDMRIFASDAGRNLVPLGTAHVNLVGEKSGQTPQTRTPTDEKPKAPEPTATDAP